MFAGFRRSRALERGQVDTAPLGMSIRKALLAGFGLTLSVWLAAGYYFTQRVADLERSASEISSRYVRAQDLVATARTQVLLTSVYLRDALIERDMSKAASERAKVEDAYAVAVRSLEQYVPVIDVGPERERVSRLQRELADWHAAIADVLEAANELPPAEAGRLLRSRIVPRREAATRIAEEMQSLNRATFVQRQAETATLYRTIQRRIWEVLGLALVAGIGIAAVASTYAGRLERDLRRVQDKDARNRRDLQRLSAALTAAQEDERRTIARELHDEVGQSLTAIKVELAIAQRSIQAAGGTPEVLQSARSITDGALHTVRDLSRLLHPAGLDDLGLSAAVTLHLREFARRHDVHADLVQEGMDDRLPPAIETALFRVIQEALTNIGKHAQASWCRVHIRRDDDSLFAVIEDNGKGFDVADQERSGARTGIGLVGIRERIAHFGGSVRMESAPDQGTRLVATLSLTRRPRVGLDQGHTEEPTTDLHGVALHG